jgi:hypothetical protein
MAATPRLDAAYTAQVKEIRARVEQFARSRFLAGQYRDPDMERFIALVVPVVLSGRKQVSTLTDAWLAAKLTAELGRKVAPRGSIDTGELRGTPADEVYRRPFVTARTELSKGKTLDAAASIAADRLSKMVASDMQLAKTHTARSVLSNTSGTEAYVRTLAGSKNCALCIIASTQVYHKSDLMPIHPGCNCGIDVIADPGRHVIDEDLLQKAHAAVEDWAGKSDSGGRDIGLGKVDAKGNRIPDYTDVIVVREHGELGPLLTVKGQHFTGPSVAA